MSYALPGYYDASAAAAQSGGRAAAFDAPPPVAVGADLIFVPRSQFQWLAFIPSLVLCAISWANGGMPALTDAGFALMTFVCGVYLAAEFFNFPRRFGIGGLVLYGGVLCWFCQDYFTKWFNHDFFNSTYHIPAEIIAKAAALHVGFILCMSASLNWRRGPVGRFFEWCLLAVPEPGNIGFYLVLIAFLFVVGISPFFLFNVEPWYMATYHAAFAGWTGGAKLFVYRTGNLNTSWGAYAAQLLQVGQVGGIFAIMFAILIARNWPQRIFAFLIWLYWGFMALASDRRGDVSFALMPLVCIVFIKYQSKTAMAFKRFSFRAYIICGVLTLGLLFIVQFQGTFRGVGFNNADLSKINLAQNQGNTMFSEGLLGYQMIPDQRPFFRNEYGIDGAVFPLVDSAKWFILGPIPRALWPNKPVDEMWSWYNRAYNGSGTGTTGTTISRGLVGSFYFKYGLWGIVEGGLLVGWLMGIGERALQHSEGRPLGILFSLAYTVWIFRTFRDFIFVDIYGLIIGGVFLSLTIWLLKPLLNPVQVQSGGV